MEAGTGSKKELTHARIVDAAARAIRARGFDGVGVAEVMKEAGLTHGGFYAHFASREAMLAEAVARAGQDSAATLARRLDGATRGAHGGDALRAIVEGYLSESHLAHPETGCTLAALGSELPRQPDELRAVAAGNVRGMVETVRRALPEGRSRQRAQAIVATMVGALQLARTLGPGAEGKAMLAAARASLLDAHPTD